MPELKSHHALLPKDRILRVVVSYAWLTEAKSARSDPRWKALKTVLDPVCAEAKKRAYKLDRRCDLSISVTRLRSRHGAQVLGSLIDRIQRADVYVADVGSNDGSYRPNVMLEIGLALAAGHGARGSLFLLTPHQSEFPSNLRGMLWTLYKEENGTIRLNDRMGFRAAFRSRLLTAAFEKGLIRRPLGVCADVLAMSECRPAFAL